MGIGKRRFQFVRVFALKQRIGAGQIALVDIPAADSAHAVHVEGRFIHRQAVFLEHTVPQFKKRVRPASRGTVAAFKEAL